MSDKELGELIVLAVVIFIIIWVALPPSRRARRRAEEEKEHELRMQELSQKEEQIRSRRKPGKVVKAKRL